MSAPLYVRWALSGGRGHKSYSPTRMSAVHIVRPDFPGIVGVKLECGRWTPDAKTPSLGQAAVVDREAFRAHPCKDCRISWTTKVQSPDIDGMARDLLFRFLGLVEIYPAKDGQEFYLVPHGRELVALLHEGHDWLAKAEANYGY